MVEKPRHDRLHPDDLALLAAAQQKHWAPKRGTWSSVLVVGVVLTAALMGMSWTSLESNSQRRQLEAEEAHLRQRVAHQQMQLASLPQGSSVNLQVSPQTSEIKEANHSFVVSAGQCRSQTERARIVGRSGERRLHPQY